MSKPKARGTLQPPATRVLGHNRLRAALKAGTIIAAAGTAFQIIATAGAARLRVRAKVTGGAATLKLRFLFPDNSDTEYATNQPADVALADGVENILDVATHMGEGLAKLSILAGGAQVTVTFVDVSQV